MSAASLPALAKFPRAVERDEATPDPFGPEVPLVWWYGRLRYSDEPDAPVQLRVREQGRRVWYDRLKSPPEGALKCPEGAVERKVFSDYRGFYATRAEARSYCEPGDAMAFVVGFPFGQEPFGDEVFDIPTFCRPEEDRRKDERDTARYTADLADHICPAMAEKVRSLEKELQHFRDLIPAAVRLSEKCDEV
jgi:hypothetical protein